MRYLISSKYKKLTLSFEAKDISCSLNLFTCFKLICKHFISYFIKCINNDPLLSLKMDNFIKALFKNDAYKKHHC